MSEPTRTPRAPPMRIDRATARRIAEALWESNLLKPILCQYAHYERDATVRVAVDAIVSASAPAKPPRRTKRGKGKR